jgi:transposase-like protein
MKTQQNDIVRKNKNKQLLEDADQEHDEVSEARKSGKSMVECICPGCGKYHIMKIHWSGRGVCRKFCQSCRDRETPLENDS